MEPLRLCLALAPLAMYFAALGVVNLSRRPVMLNGPRDTAALALAVSGLIVVGPIELFMPQMAAAEYGAYVWAMLLVFYLLIVTLIVLVQRPRLVVYNVSADELRPVLAEVVAKLDPEHRWAGNALVLPNMGIELYVESFAPLRNISLTAVGPRQSYQGWRRLENALSSALREVEVGASPYGAALLLLGLLLASAVLWQVAADPRAVAQAFFEMLRL